MTGLFGDVRENNRPAPGVSHAERFGSLTERFPGWRRGRELLLIETGDHPVVPNSPPREPRRSPNTPLWFPVTKCSDQTAGPVYTVALRGSGSLIRVRAPRQIVFLPGILTVVGHSCAYALCELDSADLSLERHLLRILRRALPLTMQGVADLVAATQKTAQPASTHTRDDLGGLPPAARRILEEIRSASPGQSHWLAYERRGASALLESLVELGLVVVLGNGHLVDSGRYESLEAVAAELGEASPQQLAEAIGCSVGFARAFRGELLRRQALDSESSERDGEL
jgi:hypothetical protein